MSFIPPFDKDGAVLFGASDDCVSIRGSITAEEFMLDGRMRVTFDTGCIADVLFDGNGLWKIDVVETGPGGVFLSSCEEEVDGRYTDYLTVPGAAGVDFRHCPA